MNISVIIPTYNRPCYLYHLLDCLSAQTIHNYEIVVVCQAYPDNILDDLANRLRLIPHHLLTYPDGIGVALAKNAGIQVATGNLIVFIDDDIEMPPTWLAALTRPFDDPTIGAVGGFVEHPGQATWWRLLYYRCFGITADRYVIGKSGFNRGLIQNPGVSQDAGWFGSGNLAVRRSVVQAMGTFDPRFRRVYEDVDFTVRIRDGGWRILFVPFAGVIHYDAKENSLNLESLVEETEAMRVYFLRKRAHGHGDWVPYYLPRLVWHCVNLQILGIRRGQLLLPLAAWRGFKRGVNIGIGA